jgi:hypothetical protein
MPGEDVDGAALTAPVERVLRVYQPAVSLEAGGHIATDAGVSFVDELGQVRPTPTRRERERHPEARRDPADHANRGVLETAALDERHCRRAHTRGCGDLSLRQATSQANRSDGVTNPYVVHVTNLSRFAYARLIGRRRRPAHRAPHRAAGRRSGPPDRAAGQPDRRYTDRGYSTATALRGAATSTSSRSRADKTAFIEAVVMFGSIPTPQRTSP